MFSLSLLVSAQACMPLQYIGKNYTIIQTQTDIPLLNVKAVKLNGTVNIEACGVVLSNFDYYPPFVKTYLYGSNDPDAKNPKSDGYKISVKEVQPAVTSNVTYELNGVDALKDIKVIKFYAEDGKLVLGYVQLGNASDSLTNATGDSTTKCISLSVILLSLFGIALY